MIRGQAGLGNFAILIAGEGLPNVQRMKAPTYFSSSSSFLWVVQLQFLICNAFWIRKQISPHCEDPYLLINFAFSDPRRHFSCQTTGSWCRIAVPGAAGAREDKHNVAARTAEAKSCHSPRAGSNTGKIPSKVSCCNILADTRTVPLEVVLYSIHSSEGWANMDWKND